MRKVVVNPDDLSLFKFVQVKERRDWMAIFSVEPGGDVYPSPTWGLAPIDLRIYVREGFPKLAEIADIYLQCRPTGGRFFINRTGAFFHATENGPYDQFIEFQVNPVVYVPPAK
ncbi:MAG TPA: hypothetical protein VN678_06135 [Acidobacteriaceae bacterium]|nr:hypothetical protein [Acidobacteriaceae bacterium]